MFSDNLKEIRKMKGLSQEEMATRLNVVRQTISKWEKGLSVPDAEMLIKIADLFGVSVSELLGAKFERENNVNDVAEQLSRINEQLAIKNRRARRVWQVIIGVVLAIIVVNILLLIMSVIGFHSLGNDKSISVSVQSEVMISGEVQE